MGDLEFLTRMLGGQIVLQTNDVLRQLLLWVVRDTLQAIIQSWRELVNRPKRCRVWTTQDEARGMDAEPPHISRPSTPLHRRALSVADILRSHDKPTGDVPNRDVLVEECCDADDIIQATFRARAQARDKLVETDDRVLNIAEVLIHVHRLRPVDISSKEHVQVLHAMEDKHIRAHTVSFYFFVVVHGVVSRVFYL